MSEPEPVPVVGARPSGPPSNWEAMKQRILSHMNKDHQVSLKDYLLFYKGITPTRNIEMRDITLEYITIGYEIVHNRGIDQLEAKIEFNPPMKSLADGRDVLVGMAMQASEGLGYATVTPVDKFILPTWRSIPIMVLVLVSTYYVYWNPTAINDSESVLRKYKVYGIEIVPLLMKAGYWAGIVFHAIETLTLYIWTGMYRVPMLKRTAWCICAFLEGFPAIGRFRTLMEENDKSSENTKKTVEKKE
ncbi:hypothetical protein POJ06DRAFT_246564 [Lipomyces tetrasporus]|uniref:DUF2470 domain-containing protein n=1 Tax=Lipomyces tetrasporus TaxID=54092 RepID=A0AAD7QX80_9ASCO|nr:uncharacterized protein POJ06DRAFT_246564 [Lipomyces tetrasporus]KAJ8103094.1 hypothetical protein POJ06DRAFT_246564 [Lipomyces tetrasporus]